MSQVKYGLNGEVLGMVIPSTTIREARDGASGGPEWTFGAGVGPHATLTLHDAFTTRLDALEKNEAAHAIECLEKIAALEKRIDAIDTRITQAAWEAHDIFEMKSPSASMQRENRLASLERQVRLLVSPARPAAPICSACNRAPATVGQYRSDGKRFCDECGRALLKPATLLTKKWHAERIGAVVGITGATALAYHFAPQIDAAVRAVVAWLGIGG